MTNPDDPTVEGIIPTMKTPPPFVGRVLGYVQLYGERKRVGGGGRIRSKVEDLNIMWNSSSLIGTRIIGGALSSTGTPPPPPTSKQYQNHRSGRAIPQVPGGLVGQSQGQPTRHCWSQLDTCGQ